MGEYERRQTLDAALNAMNTLAGNTQRVRVTRTIVVEGPREWVTTTIAKSYVPDIGDSPILAPDKKISCTDRKLEVV